MFWRWVIVIGAMMAAIIGVRLLYPERSSVRQEGITGHPAETNTAVNYATRSSKGEGYTYSVTVYNPPRKGPRTRSWRFVPGKGNRLQLFHRQREHRGRVLHRHIPPRHVRQGCTWPRALPNARLFHTGLRASELCTLKKKDVTRRETILYKTYATQCTVGNEQMRPVAQRRVSRTQGHH